MHAFMRAYIVHICMHAFMRAYIVHILCMHAFMRAYIFNFRPYLWYIVLIARGMSQVMCHSIENVIACRPKWHTDCGISCIMYCIYSIGSPHELYDVLVLHWESLCIVYRGVCSAPCIVCQAEQDFVHDDIFLSTFWFGLILLASFFFCAKISKMNWQITVIGWIFTHWGWPLLPRTAEGLTLSPSNGRGINPFSLERPRY